MTKEPADSSPKTDLNVKKSKKRDIKEVSAIKRQSNSGLRNPLKLETDETVFSSSSFSDLKISDKLVGVMFTLQS